MRTNQANRSTPNLVDKPERVGPALAQVIRVDENGRDEILGQAWLAAPNRMITCGHVIDRFAAAPQLVSVLFPATGKRYPVLEIRLHPSFVRQPDGLVKFDVAVLSVQLAPPDSNAQPLPFSYEQSLRINQQLWTIRFPAHLGQLSAAVQPLSQDGRFLGLLRKHDSFHLLHDVPLSPGDSGSPICDARGIVAIHCGDTATLPGLNLATTSIRLMLWVDALRELGLAETRKTYINRASRLATAVVIFIVMFSIAFGAGTYAFQKPKPPAQEIANPAMMPLGITFNKTLNEYEKGKPIKITLEPSQPCYAYMWIGYADDPTGTTMPLYPADGKPHKISDATIIEQDSTAEPLTAPETKAVKLYVLSVKADDPPGDQFVGSFTPPTNIKQLTQIVDNFEKEHPDRAVLTQFDIPRGK